MKAEISLLVFFLIVWSVFSQDDNVIDDCGLGFRLTRFFLNETAFPDARCADGTIGGFYLSVNESERADLIQNPPNRSFVIWLGDSPICSGEDCTELCEGSAQETAGTGICEGVDDILDQNLDFDEIDDDVARCLAARATCTTDWWEFFSEVTAGTILCEEDQVFGQFKRAFLPSCTLDYWLGAETDTSLPAGGFSDTLFRGSVVFDAVIETLIDEQNLTFAPKIVFGGTRGGGIGALHLVNRLRELVTTRLAEIDPLLTPPEIYLLIDSSWIVSTERFAPSEEDKLDLTRLFSLPEEYRVNTSEWIDNSAILQSCKDKFPIGERFQCLFPAEIIKHHLNANDPDNNLNRALIFQSQYDLFQLSDLGILDFDATERFEDEIAFAQAALNFIENFGQQVRNSIDETARSVQPIDGESPVGFFTPACGQHGFIVPTRIHTINARTEDIGDAGSIRFQRDEFAWRTITTDDSTLRDLIVDFTVNDVLPSLQSDFCGEFLCNDECVTEIFPFAIEPIVSECIQQLVLVYASMLIFFFMLIFVSSYLRIQTWRKSCKRFWKVTNTIANEEKAEEDGAKKFEILDQGEKDEVEFLRILAIQRDQTADEVQEQLIAETNADNEYRRVHLMAENLSYWAPPKPKKLKDKLLCKATKPGTQIIRDISISFEPGQVHALMGPSGSGKSTMLELLSLSKTSGKMSGTRFINGVSANAKVASFMKTWLKHNQSYVSQQDSFFPTLTVREHLEHAAWLVLPEYMPAETKLNRVWQLIRLLDLTSCADTICGDGGITYEGGISGGQRRRLSVATQLLNNPCVLFLDEPTSGLDSVSALNLCRRLNKFAKKAGMNVIMTIHQPRREIYSEIDRLYILVKGRLIFAGDVDSTATFFNLDLANPRLNVGNELLDQLKDIDDPDDPEILTHLERFRSSEHYAQILEEIAGEKTTLTEEVAAEIKEILVFNSLAEGRFSWRSPGSVLSLQRVLLSRTLQRGGFNIKLTMILASLAGMVLGGLFYQADDYDSKVGLAYLMVSTLTFLQGVFLARRYFDEKDVYDYEKRAGTLRSWQAFLMNQYSRDAMTSVLESLAFAIPAYLLGGFSLEIERAGNFIVLTTLIGFATTCQNVLFQIERNDVREAAFIQIGLLALGALFNGFIVQLDDLPIYYSWIPYLMLNFYGFVGILINELANFSLPCDLSDLECASRTGDVVLQFFSYDSLDVFICALALIIFIIVTRTLSTIIFYRRYAKESKLTKVAGDGVSKPAKRELESQNQGKTLQHVLTKQTAAMALKKNNKLVEEDNDGDSVKLSEIPTQRNALQSRRRDTQQNKTPAANEIFDEYDEDNSEFDDDNEDEANNNASFGSMTGTLVSKTSLSIFYLLDLATAGYVCAFNEDTETLVFGVSAVFLLLYLLQFVFQLGYTLPYTLENDYNDFFWASDLDGFSLLLFIVDAALVFVQVSSVDSIFIIQVLTLAIRIVRLFRVQLFYYKVSRSHRIRAESFLAAKNRIVLEYIQQMNQNAEQQEELPLPTNRLSGRNWLANLRINERPVSSGEHSAGRNPRRRPKRPARPGSAFGSQSQNTPSQFSNTSGNRRSLGNAFIAEQMNKLRMRPGNNFVRQRSNTARNGVQANTEDRNIYTQANGWFKYRNEETGKMVYYNKFTGKYVDVATSHEPPV